MLRDTDNELVSHFFSDAAVARDRRGLSLNARCSSSMRRQTAQFAVEGLLWENSIVQSAA